jgi:anti-sigma B factor antagonist
MEWAITRQAGAHVAQPRGKIDETSWAIFSERLIEAVDGAARAGERLIVDLSAVDYMSSRGLRALTMARKQAGDAVEIILAAPNPRMREILAISRYDKIFPVTDTVAPSP